MSSADVACVQRLVQPIIHKVNSQMVNATPKQIELFLPLSESKLYLQYIQNVQNLGLGDKNSCQSRGDLDNCELVVIDFDSLCPACGLQVREWRIQHLGLSREH